MSRAKPWRELSREKLLDCRVFEVERSVCASPVDASEHDYFRVRNGDWVQIVPVTANDEIVMVRQWRHGSSSIVLEIPGGLVDAGEDPAGAAQRECLEETGYRAERVIPMGALNPNPAIHTSPLHAFYAPGVEKAGEPQNSATEQTEVVLVPVASLADRLLRGEIDHALIVGTLWRFLHEYV